MRKLITAVSLFSALFFSQIHLTAQDIMHKQVPIVKDGNILELAGFGGLNAPQVSTIDWNRDGKQDLLVFDRVGDVVIPLIFQGEEGSLDYTIDWSYKTNLPPFRFWVLARDYNQDGLADFFTAAIQSGVPGITVYKAVEENGSIFYEKQVFDGRDYLLIPVGGGDTNVYVSWEDIPSIDDTDGDGDLDIVCFDPGGSRITLYKNLSVENGWGLDSLDFVVGDDCWGKVLESELSEELFLSNDPDLCSTGGFNDPIIQVRHSGSTITTFDQNGDGAKEALIGDITSRSIVYAQNGGTIDNAWINDQDAHWPSYDSSVDLAFFGAGYHLDVNHDGLSDVLIGSNTRSFGEKQNVLWYYENIASNENQIFELQKKNLFVEQMLDFGSESNPTFGDVNGDGLIDIVVGSFISDVANNDRLPSLHLLLNTGTAEAPQFELSNEDYLGMSQYVNLPKWSLTPDFGDLDADGDVDLIVGNNDGELFYFENIAGTGMAMNFADEQYPYSNIDVGGSSAPTIYDADGDGLNDLIIGERNSNFDDQGNCGSLTFFKNIGSVGNAQFDPAQIAPNTACFGRVVLNPVPGIPVYAKPRAVTVEGKQVLFISDDKGKIRMLTGIENDIYGAFDLDNENFGDLKDGFRIGYDLADIDHDGKIDFVVGNIRGGLTFYGTNLTAISTSIEPKAFIEQKFSILPNPVGQQFRLKHDQTLEIQSIRLLDMSGRMIFQQKYIPGQSYSTRGFSSGVYQVIIQSRENIWTEKLIVLKNG